LLRPRTALKEVSVEGASAPQMTGDHPRTIAIARIRFFTS